MKKLYLIRKTFEYEEYVVAENDDEAEDIFNDEVNIFDVDVQDVDISCEEIKVLPKHFGDEIPLGETEGRTIFEIFDEQKKEHVEDESQLKLNI